MFVLFPRRLKRMKLRMNSKKAGPISSIKLKDFEQKINGETVISY